MQVKLQDIVKRAVVITVKEANRTEKITILKG